jgi:Fe-S-cluster containining protein
MYRAEKDGETPGAIMARAAGLKVPCPLLDEDDRCLLYAARPITCRVYGVPAAIAAQTHVCGFSGFEKGKPYPTMYLDKIQSRLDGMSREITTAVNSRFSALHEVYVPLSMALLTKYDATYLGAGPAKREN